MWNHTYQAYRNPRTGKFSRNGVEIPTPMMQPVEDKAAAQEARRQLRQQASPRKVEQLSFFASL